MALQYRHFNDFMALLEYLFLITDFHREECFLKKR